MGNFDGCFDPCNGYNCNTGCDSNTCPTDYNPVSVNNNNAPNVEGSVSQGGTGQGGAGGTGGTGAGDSSANNTLSLSINGSSVTGTGDCATCCKEGMRELLNFLYDIAIDPQLPVTLYAYGNLIPNQNQLSSTNVYNLLSLTASDIQNISICGDIVNTNEGIVSLCAISLIVFTFDGTDQNLAIKAAFKNGCNGSCECNCSCECGKSIAKALCINGLGGTYSITIQDVINIVALTPANLTNLSLVALDCNIAIFTNGANPFLYYAIPTCKIAEFLKAV